jgi:hypothetical protein
MLWFGWIKVKQQKIYLDFDSDPLERTPLLEKTFRLNVQDSKARLFSTEKFSIQE